jgi:uncharacterized repeat protein (TIGR03803 family)
LGLCLASSVRLAAQTFATLYSFSSLHGTNSDGANPIGGLILSGNTLYGTASAGGNPGEGTVFGVNTDGTGFTNLYNFRGGTNGGALPWAGMILSGSTLFGTTVGSSGSGSYGSVFRVNTDGSGFTNLHGFTAPLGLAATNSHGANPYGGLVLSGSTLYGTAHAGGAFGAGTIFALSTDGSSFTTLYNFAATSPTIPHTNNDGANPYGGLTLSGNILYGTAFSGGSSGNGILFAINTNGSGFTNLHNFMYSDGASPRAGLIRSGTVLYGTTQAGGNTVGTVFKVNIDGTGFTNLHSFAPVSGSPWTNSDGAIPYAGLFLSGNTLYGTTTQGGNSGYGTVFAVNTDGTGFTNLYSFAGAADGAGPSAVFLSGNTLYGAAGARGITGSGTLFTLSLPVPQLRIIHSGTDVVLSWPTNATGFSLLCTTNLASPALWTNAFPEPVVVDGDNVVTNPISGAEKLYRLVQ